MRGNFSPFYGPSTHSGFADLILRKTTQSVLFRIESSRAGAAELLYKSHWAGNGEGPSEDRNRPFIPANLVILVFLAVVTRRLAGLPVYRELFSFAVPCSCYFEVVLVALRDLHVRISLGFQPVLDLVVAHCGTLSFCD